MKTIFINKNMPIDSLKIFVKELEDKEDFQTNNTGVVKTVYVNNNFDEIFNDLIYSYNEDDYDLFIIVLDHFLNDEQQDELINTCKKSVNSLKQNHDFQIKTFISNNLVFE